MTDVNHIARPQARGGLPVSYTIADIKVTANNMDEIHRLMQAMQSWANGTFEAVVMVRPEPSGPLIVSPKEKIEPVEPEVDMFGIAEI